MKKKIFVTGSRGFLGSHLVPRLKREGHQVDSPSSKELNLFSKKHLDKIKKKYDEIYHLAAWTEAGDFCLKYPASQWIKNESINLNIVQWWVEKQKNAKLIFIGTSCCYDEKETFLEKNYLNEKPHSSLATYAMTKKSLLQAAIACQIQHKMEWLCFVPSTLYGINYLASNKQNHFIFDLIKKILRGKFLENKVTLWGDGNQKREIINVKDFIDNMILVNSISKNNLYNVGAGKAYPIKYFAKIICKIINYDFEKIKFDKSKYIGAKFKKLSINKISKLNKNYKKNLINIHEGLKNVIEWHIRNKRY
jgi:GDP-L-fucose synthase